LSGLWEDVSFNTFITAAHDNKRNYPSPQDTWAYRQGHVPKIELTNESTAVSSTILETPKDDQCWSKLVVCILQSCRGDFNV
jgi:hypothetical protein